MSITKEKSYEEYIAKPGVPFFITFEYERREDLEVTVNNHPVDFVVNDDKVEGFTFNENDIIKIYRNTQPIQTRSFNQSDFLASEIENAIDKLTMKAQDQDRKIGTSLRIAGEVTKRPLIMDINTIVTVDEFGEFKTIPKSEFKGDTPGFQTDGDKIRFSQPDGSWGNWIIAPRGYSPDFEIVGGKIRFKKPDNTWGEWLIAPTGEKGDPPAHEIDSVNKKIRFKKPDNTWGDWILIDEGLNERLKILNGVTSFSSISMRPGQKTSNSSKALITTSGWHKLATLDTVFTHKASCILHLSSEGSARGGSMSVLCDFNVSNTSKIEGDNCTLKILGRAMGSEVHPFQAVRIAKADRGTECGAYLEVKLDVSTEININCLMISNNSFDEMKGWELAPIEPASTTLPDGITSPTYITVKHVSGSSKVIWSGSLSYPIVSTDLNPGEYFSDWDLIYIFSNLLSKPYSGRNTMGVVIMSNYADVDFYSTTQHLGWRRLSDTSFDLFENTTSGHVYKLIGVKL